VTKEVVLTVGQRAELSFRLEVNPLTEAIEILSKTQLLEARRTSVATTIVDRLIKDLPSRARDVSASLSSTPLQPGKTRPAYRPFR